MIREANAQVAKGNAWGGERLIQWGRKGYRCGALTKSAVENYGKVDVNSDLRPERLHLNPTRQGTLGASKSMNKHTKASRPV